MNRQNIITLVVVAVVGTALLVVVRAASDNVSVEPGSQGGTAEEVKDDTASNGSYTLFKNPIGDPECENPIIINPPGVTLAQKVDRADPGTCFRLTNGTYRTLATIPKDNMIFEGESREGVIIDGSDTVGLKGAPRYRYHAFSGVAKNVTIRNMQFTNFKAINYWGNLETWYQMTPVLGKDRLFGDFPEEYAEGWVIDNIASHNNIGSGISLGANFTVTNSSFYKNGMVGILGTATTGGLIENNKVYENGGGTSAGTAIIVHDGINLIRPRNNDNEPTDIKSERPITIRNNQLRDNQGDGLHCTNCNGAIVEGNIASGNFTIWEQDGKRYGKNGLFFEFSHGITVSSNSITNSSHQSYPAHGCISTQKSNNVTIESNKLNQCHAAIAVHILRTGFGPESDARNISVKNNQVTNSTGVGVFFGEDAERIPNLDENLTTIKFENNKYDSPENMTFWWGRRELNYSQWQELGQQ